MPNEQKQTPWSASTLLHQANTSNPTDTEEIKI
jgi:hypothetical protein